LIAAGVVWVTREQAKAAAAFGWKIVGKPTITGIVTVSRSAEGGRLCG
jgi:hypothetical protein